MIRILIADDEPLARSRVRSLLSGWPDVAVVGECRDGMEAVAAIRAEPPDLVFLDIQMPKLDGFGVVASIGADRMPGVVFVTAYDEYAVRAFEVHAMDYLLKPLDPVRFRDALDRAIRGIERGMLAELRATLARLSRPPAPPLAPAEASSGRRDRVAVRTGVRIEFVDPEEIDWAEAAGNYVRLRGRGGTHLVRRTMDDLHSVLGANRFVRIRRSVLVRIHAIAACEQLVRGSYVFIMRDGTRLISSRYFRAHLTSLLD